MSQTHKEISQGALPVTKFATTATFATRNFVTQADSAKRPLSRASELQWNAGTERVLTERATGRNSKDPRVTPNVQHHKIVTITIFVPTKSVRLSETELVVLPTLSQTVPTWILAIKRNVSPIKDASGKTSRVSPTTPPDVSFGLVIWPTEFARKPLTKLVWINVLMIPVASWITAKFQNVYNPTLLKCT